MAFVPIAHLMSKRARERRNKELSSLINRSPFEVSPRVGLYGYVPVGDELGYSTRLEEDEEAGVPKREGANPQQIKRESSFSTIPFKCKSFNVEAKVVHTTAKVRITMQIMIATEEFDFYFPISECGEVSDVHTSLRGVSFAPTVVRRGPESPPQSPSPQCEKHSGGANGTGSSSSNAGTDRKQQKDQGGKQNKDTDTSSFSKDTDATCSYYDRDTIGLISSTDSKRFLPPEDEGTDRGANNTSTKQSKRAKKTKEEEPAVYYLYFRKLSGYVKRLSAAAMAKRELDAKLEAAGVLGGATRGSSSSQQKPSEDIDKGSDSSGGLLNTKPIAPGTVVTLVVSYTTKLIEKEPIGTRFHFLFPLACAPIPPTSMCIDFSMKENIQRIVSLNESHVIRPHYHGDRAEVMVVNDRLTEDQTDTKSKRAGNANLATKKEKEDAERRDCSGQFDALGNRIKVPRGSREPNSGRSTAAADDEMPATSKSGNSSRGSKEQLTKRDCSIMLEDYVFVLVIELGPVIVPQFADPMTLFILATAAAMFLFAALTKDLDDLY